MGNNKGAMLSIVMVRMHGPKENPNPNGNRAQRRAAKKLKIKPEHVVKDDNVNP